MRAFDRNETILTVEGPTIQYAFEHDYRVGSNWLQIGSNTWKIPLTGNLWNFINHSCAPNVGLRGTSRVVAMRPIHAGEELTIDYSITEAGQHWHMRCQCHTSQCREVIRSTQFLSREFFDQYKPFIPGYLRRVYLAQKTYTTHINGRRRLMAKRYLKRNEHVFSIEGPVVRYQFPPHYRIGYQWIASDHNEWIVPLRSNPWWSIRHSCEPNVGVIRKNRVVAMRAINPDEELVVDDSMVEADVRWKRKCDCGSSQCRGVVRSVQFLPSELYSSYQPFMPRFMKQVYKMVRL